MYLSLLMLSSVRMCVRVYLGIEMASCCVLLAKKKQIAHAYIYFFFSSFPQLDKKEMRTLLVVFPRIELIEWLTGQL